MLTRVNQKNGDCLSILGFGCMRFPTKAGNIDMPRAIDMYSVPIFTSTIVSE